MTTKTKYTLSLAIYSILFLLGSSCFFKSEPNFNSPAQPLHKAAATGDKEEIIRLIKKEKVSVDKVDDFDATALHIAAYHGNNKAIETLIKLGANKNAKEGRSGRTPLHIAVESKKIEAIRTLADQGANLNAKDNRGSTALHMAIPHENFITTLIELGAHIDEQDKRKRTPLHRAAYAGLYKTVKLLLDKNADETIRDHENYTAYQGVKKRIKELEKLKAKEFEDFKFKKVADKIAESFSEGNASKSSLFSSRSFDFSRSSELEKLYKVKKILAD